MCGNGVHFEDDNGMLMEIFSDGPKIVCMSSGRNGKYVRGEHCLSGYHMRLDGENVLLAKGGCPFRFCGWIEKRRMALVLIGGPGALLKSVPIQFST